MTLVAAEAGVFVLGERDASVRVGQELGRCRRLERLGRVDSVRGALDAVRAHRPDVLVVEVSSAARLRELTAGFAASMEAMVVVVSALPAEGALLPALAAGARAFLRSPLEPGLLERAIEAVLAGHAFVDPRSTQWLVEVALHGNLSRPHDGLTFRQSQVVGLVRSGLTNREIAAVLDVSLATVKSHLHTAMQRLGAGNRWAATVLAERLREDRS